MDLPGVLIECLKAEAAAADAAPVWPLRSWEALGSFGVLGWVIPSEFGGQALSPADLLTGYEHLAGACLTTCFILSQRDAAVRRILGSGNEELCRELLRPLACGGRFATVGLSQLSTSRQHQQPAMAARLVGNAIHLNGTMPWVTGAAEAHHFITGAVLDDGRQILAVLPAEAKGVSVAPPLDLMALQGSLTAEVRCEDVCLDRHWLLDGPAEKVMATGRGGTGGLETSCLALGLAGAAIDYLHAEAAARPELRASAANLERERGQVRRDLHQLAGESCPAEAAAALRTQANNLVLRATQAALTAAKGAGFLRDHPAQRWARQALFFLVWSCPRPVAEATLAYLAPPGESDCP
jgi:alkylation response protein AidB-like acyl-CoA dehydrogenase